MKEGHCNRRSPRLACPSLFSAPLPALNNEVPQSPLENADRTLLAQLALRFGPKFQYNCLDSLSTRDRFPESSCVVFKALAITISPQVAECWGFNHSNRANALKRTAERMA